MTQARRMDQLRHRQADIVCAEWHWPTPRGQASPSRKPADSWRFPWYSCLRAARTRMVPPSVYPSMAAYLGAGPRAPAPQPPPSLHGVACLRALPPQLEMEVPAEAATDCRGSGSGRCRRAPREDAHFCAYRLGAPVCEYTVEAGTWIGVGIGGHFCPWLQKFTDTIEILTD
jgi:hypothetical protein